MSNDEGKAIQPEHIFKRIVWRSSIEMGEALERSTTWTIGGVAAIVGLLVSNLDSVAKIASLEGIKTSIVLFTLSLLSGAMSKQLGMAVVAGVNTLKQMDSLLASEDGQQLMDRMTIKPTDLIRELSEPFLWPMSAVVKKSGNRGATDYVAADKTFVKMFCIQIALNMLHGLFALAALLAIGLSI